MRTHDQACDHLVRTTARAHGVRPSGPGCQECLERGGAWVHLRLCLRCGHVGCCDSSPSRHATRHFHATGHPVIKSFEPDEAWAWCYVDEQLLEELPAFPGETPSHHLQSPADAQP